MFYRIGRFSYRRRRIVIALWLIALVLSAPLIPRLTQVLEVGGFSNPDIEAARARALLEESLPGFAPSTLVVIFESEALTARDPAFVAQAELALRDVVTLPAVTDVAPSRAIHGRYRAMATPPTPSSTSTCPRSSRSG
jgi:uncharacterized membrane protein YdfJ with MMPL/SSD domain